MKVLLVTRWRKYHGTNLTVDPTVDRFTPGFTISSLRLPFVIALLIVLSTWQHKQPIYAQAASGITSPAPGSSVSGAVPIIGTAAITPFQRYELYYKLEPNGDDAYIYFDGDTRQVVNGQLGVWQTGSLAPGTYTLRLRVVKADGNYSEHFAPDLNINLQPATPTATATPDEPTATPIPIDTPTPVPQPTPAVVQVQQPDIGGSGQETTGSTQETGEPTPTAALVALDSNNAGPSQPLAGDSNSAAPAESAAADNSLTANITQELGEAVALDRLRERFMTGVRYSAGIFLVIFAIFAGKRLLEWTLSRAG